MKYRALVEECPDLERPMQVFVTSQSAAAEWAGLIFKQLSAEQRKTAIVRVYIAEERLCAEHHPEQK